MWNLAKLTAASLSRSRRLSTAIPGPCIVHKRGADILHDPWFNKDTGFPLTERDRLGIRGLLPPRVISFEQQYARFMESYRSLERNTHGQPDGIVSLAKWRILNRLHDRNETLYYRVLIDNIKDFAPIIYTPTVGLVCQNYSGLFRRPRGMYFSAKDKGEMMSMIYNWPGQQDDSLKCMQGASLDPLEVPCASERMPVCGFQKYLASYSYKWCTIDEISSSGVVFSEVCHLCL